SIALREAARVWIRGRTNVIYVLHDPRTEAERRVVRVELGLVFIGRQRRKVRPPSPGEGQGLLRRLCGESLGKIDGERSAVRSSAKNASNAARDEKCVDRPELRCSTRPSNRRRCRIAGAKCTTN